MNRTFCLLKDVAPWIFCVLACCFSPCIFGQALPPLRPVSVSTFTLPFEVDEAAAIREVELLVSKDRGKRWHSAERQPVEAGKFTFHADSNGEYWFAVRTTARSGVVSPMDGLPQWRVLVESKSPVIVLSSQPSESGPLTPPKPMRFRDGQAPAQGGQTNTPPESKSVQNVPANTVRPDTEKPAPTLLGPRLPGLELPEVDSNRDADLLEDLLGGMSPFLDVLPVATPSIPSGPVAADRSGPPSPPPPPPPAASPAPTTSSATPLSPGSITGIALNTKAVRPQVIVRWNTGHEPWHDAQIDILRSSTKEGQPTPVAINLPNNGEYWWFLTPEDLKPFHVTVRIRHLHGGIHTDTTPMAITIDPQSLVPQDERP